MTYISMLVALFKTLGFTGSGTYAWMDAYLDNLVAVEQWFLNVTWTIWGILVVVVIVLKSMEIIDFEATLGCGCVMLITLFLPLWEWLTLLLSKGMASAVTPSQIIAPGKLIICAFFIIVLGPG